MLFLWDNEESANVFSSAVTFFILSVEWKAHHGKDIMDNNAVMKISERPKGYKALVFFAN